MNEILQFIEQGQWLTALASLISFGGLLFVVKIIVNVAKTLNSDRIELNRQITTNKRLDLLAKILVENANLYKNAVINSSLSPEAKLQVLEDYQKVNDLYLEYVEGINEEPEIAELPENVEDLLNSAVDVGTDALAKLKEKIEN